MPGTKNLTKREAYQLILPNANSTNSGFTAKKPNATQPSGDGVFVFNQDTNIVELSFFGIGTDATSFNTRIYGWRKCENSKLFVPSLLAELACTLDAATTDAAEEGSIPTASDKLVDTIAKTSGAASVVILSGTAGEMASARLDVYGMTWIEIVFDISGVTSANGWISTL